MLVTQQKVLRRFWYALMPMAHLDDGPKPFRLLGTDLVLWKQADGSPVALADRCCHRTAKLSRGFVENGHIVCGYHGWTYDCSGACVRIPQQPDLQIPAGARVPSYRAQEKYGKKPLTGEQVRWGLENLAIDDRKIKAMGFEGFMLPLSTSCADHMGISKAMIHQWDGKKWTTEKKIYEADMTIIKPMIDQAAKKYAGEKKLEYRDCAKDAS